MTAYFALSYDTDCEVDFTCVSGTVFEPNSELPRCKPLPCDSNQKIKNGNITGPDPVGIFVLLKTYYRYWMSNKGWSTILGGGTRQNWASHNTFTTSFTHLTPSAWRITFCRQFFARGTSSPPYLPTPPDPTLSPTTHLTVFPVNSLVSDHAGKCANYTVCGWESYHLSRDAQVCPHFCVWTSSLGDGMYRWWAWTFYFRICSVFDRPADGWISEFRSVYFSC